MKIGTKSIVYGIHNPVLHGVMVLRAWLIVYGRCPSLSELIAIFLHDIGYGGMPDMDGKYGKRHPEVSARVISKIFNKKKITEMVLYHSRFYACEHNQNVSALALPDKLAFRLYPKWLYLLLSTATGEIYEYKKSMNCSHMTNSEWFEETSSQTLQWCLNNCTRQQRSRLLQRYQIAKI